MRAGFALLCFKSGRISFSIHLTTPTEFSVMFCFVRPVAFDTFGSLNTAQVSGMPPLPAVFALGNTGIQVCSTKCGDVFAYVEASIDQKFSV